MLLRVTRGPRNRGSNSLREIRRPQKGLFGTTGNKRTGDTPRKPLFPINLQHPFDFRYSGFFKPLGGRYAGVRIHAHIKGPVHAERKPAFGVINLRTAHTDVHQDARHPGNSARSEFFGHTGKRGMNDRKARIRQRRRSLHRFGIPVKRNDAPLRT